MLRQLCFPFRYHAAINGILTIKQVAMSDAKQYKCTAENKLGTNTTDFRVVVQGRYVVNFMISVRLDSN